MKDARDLRVKPMDTAQAQPIGEDLYHWHGNILIPLKYDSGETKNAVMHIHIELLDKFPMSAPNVGFCADFDYWGGAQDTIPNGVLKGMKMICMNILNNYINFHSEWEKDVGAGWSPSMTIRSLLV